jgi:hypothetical protein
MITFIIISFCIALSGYTYSIILTDPGMILDKWFIFLQSMLEEKHEKWFNVLVNCPKCVSGQLALWGFFFTPYFTGFNSIHLHILFIVITIWFTLVLNKFYIWLKN